MRLLNGTVFIDQFKPFHEDNIYLLTHWHKDHLKGLSNIFKGIVFCSEITATLVKNSFPDVKVQVVKLNRFIPRIPVKILVIDSNHLPGSIMFYIPQISTLYTGDYRLNDDMIKYLQKRVKRVETIFADGTYHDPRVDFLSEAQSVDLMREFISNVSGPIAIGVFHIGTCALLSRMGIGFKIDKTVSKKLRTALLTMFPNYIEQTSRFLLVHPHKFNNKSYTIIIPSSLWFSCKGNMKHVHKIVLDLHGQWRINYTCHSDYWDNLYLKNKLKAEKLILLNQSRVNLKCF